MNERLLPIEGAIYDKSRPETRDAWLAERAAGITATEIRDWQNGAKRREIIAGKIEPSTEDLSHVPAIAHGNAREPIIAQWIELHFGIEPCDSVFKSARNERHLASPDGISRDPFTGELFTGADAALAEIKTSKHDLTPGQLDAEFVLISIDRGSKFDQTNYFDQMQWQMYVMEAGRTLFVWEQHDGEIDPITGTFRPMEIRHCWVMRDDAHIEMLVARAERALAEIDDALEAASSREALSAVDVVESAASETEIADLGRQLLEARAAESAAKKRRESIWARLNELVYVEGENSSHVFGDVKINLTTTVKPVAREVVDEEAMTRRAPSLVARYAELRSRYTSEVIEEKTSTTLTVTPNKEKKA